MSKYKRVSGDALEYEVFARATYDEERWCEMAIVRKDHVIELWSPGES